MWMTLHACERRCRSVQGGPVPCVFDYNPQMRCVPWQSDLHLYQYVHKATNCDDFARALLQVDCSLDTAAAARVAAFLSARTDAQFIVVSHKPQACILGDIKVKRVHYWHSVACRDCAAVMHAAHDVCYRAGSLLLPASCSETVAALWQRAVEAALLTTMFRVSDWHRLSRSFTSRRPVLWVCTRTEAPRRPLRCSLAAAAAWRTSNSMSVTAIRS